MSAPAACHRHPERETGLRCGACGRSICVECVRQHPVGIRCGECANPAPLPTYRVSSGHVARGTAAALVLGVAGAVGLRLVLGLLPGAGFLFLLIMIGVGYLMGEGVSAAVNRRRGRTYQYLALGAALLATAPVSLPSLAPLSVGALLNLAGVGAAAVVAWNRLAP